MDSKRMDRRCFKALVFGLALSVLSCLSTNILAQDSSDEPAWIYMVRHAEKQGGKNPALTSEGAERAEDLARVLSSTPLSVVLSTDFKRTLETAAPTAKAQGLQIQKLTVESSETHIEELSLLLDAAPAGSRWLVVGHSNTVPAVLERLGCADTPRTLDEKTAYDNLFVVRLQSEKPECLQLKFGAPVGDGSN